MKENLTDKERLEIEEIVDEYIESRYNNGYIMYSIAYVFNIAYWITAFLFLFTFPIVGIIFIIIGIFGGKRGKPSYHLDKAKEIKETEKEKLIRKLQKNALNGKDWKQNFNNKYYK